MPHVMQFGRRAVLWPGQLNFRFRLEMTTRTIVSTPTGPPAVGPYSLAIKAQGLVFVSGQLGLDPATHQLVVGGVEAHTERAIRNTQLVLRAAGSDLERVVRCVVYLTTMEHFAAMNKVYERFFDKDKPARTTVAVSGLPRNSLVEIEATALASRRPFESAMVRLATRFRRQRA
jgi:2-iminobutanoate/2-iminopropanoate deaminase